MKNTRFKLFGILHVADLLWILLIGLLVYGAVQFSSPLDLVARQGDVRIRFTIEMGYPYPLIAGFHQNIPIEGRLFDGVRGLELGEIVDVFARAYTEPVFDEAAGVVRHAAVDGFEMMFVVVETTASISDFETVVNGHPIAVGRELFARSKHFAGLSFIVAIEVLEGR